MVVIVIISVLLALLVPALQRARIAANEARVVTEIKQLDSAIAAFKAKYGVEPPSQCSIYLNQAGWNNNPAAMALVRRIWPQFDFSMGNGAGVTYPAFWTQVAAAQPNGAVNFNSGEAMLFFLGGIIPAPNTVVLSPGSRTTSAPSGFAKNPIYPFAPPTVSPNREGPFFEFADINRIHDVDGNGINEWYDPLPNQPLPYLYFSAYEGRGYNIGELPVGGGNYTFVHDVYRVSSVAATSGNNLAPPATPPASPTGSQLLPAQKPQSWQIISPGYDGLFGFGGIFNQSLPNSGLSDPNGNPDVAAYDNLTNFNGGRLNP